LVYRQTKDGRTEIPLTFAAKGSIFLIFERPQALHLTEVWKDGNEVFPSARLGVGAFSSSDSGLIASDPGTYRTMDSTGHSKTFAIPSALPAAPTFGPWTLSFPDGWGAPSSVPVRRFQSWTESQNPGVRYFSGTATYSSTLHIPRAQLSTQRQVWLDLGNVREIASVVVNGIPVQTMWREPFVARIDHQLHAGDNKVEIKVTNLWPNRLIGDLQPSATTRYTHTNVRAYTKDSPLLPSGLLEPVSVRTDRVQQLR
jgi:hypothetical protein